MTQAELKQHPVKVVIDRTRWLRGEGNTASKLLRERDQKMCCLGFAALALGCATTHILGEGMVEDVLRLRFLKDPTVGDLYEANDNEDTTDAEKEAKITRLGNEIGLRFTFTN